MARKSASTPPFPVLWARHVRPPPRRARLARLGRLLPDVADHRSTVNAALGSVWRFGSRAALVVMAGASSCWSGLGLTSVSPAGLIRARALKARPESANGHIGRRDRERPQSSEPGDPW